MDKKIITPQNIMLITLFLFTIIIAALILKPLVSALLTAIIIGYIFYPIFKFVKEKIKNKTTAALIVSIFIVLIIIIPSFLIINNFANEAFTIYTNAKHMLATEGIQVGFCEGKSNIICNFLQNIKNNIGNMQIKYYIQNGLEKLTSGVINWTAKFAAAIPMKLLEGLIIIVTIFYYFKDHKKVIEKLKLIIPLDTKYRQDILKQIDNVTYAIVFGYIVVAILEGIIGAIGLKILVPNSAYIFWGLVIAFTAIVPLIGAGIVWCPAIIIQAISGSYFSVLGLLICWGMTAYIDTVIRAEIIGKRADIHPIYILVGVIGGIAFIGLPGVVIGPVTLALLNTFVNIFTGNKIDKEIKEEKQNILQKLKNKLKKKDSKKQ